MKIRPQLSSNILNRRTDKPTNKSENIRRTTFHHPHEPVANGTHEQEFWSTWRRWMNEYRTQFIRLKSQSDSVVTGWRSCSVRDSSFNDVYKEKTYRCQVGRWMSFYAAKENFRWCRLLSPAVSDYADALYSESGPWTRGLTARM